MTREECKQLAYREKQAEAAMFHICRELYKIDVPNHPVKDGYRIGFNEGVKYAKKIFLEKACEWITEHIDIPYEGEFINNSPIASDYVECLSKRLDYAKAVAEAFKQAMEE